MLEPEGAYMDEDESRFAMGGRFAGAEAPWELIGWWHPRVCLASERTHRSLILVAMKTEADKDDGMAIYEVKWNEGLSGIRWDPYKCVVVEEDREKLRHIKLEFEFLEHVSATKSLERLDALGEEA